MPKQARIAQVTQVVELRPFKHFQTDITQGLDSVEADITQCLNAFVDINLPKYIDSQQPQQNCTPPQRRRHNAMFGPIMEGIMPGLDTNSSQKVPRTISLLFLSQRCYNAITPLVHKQPALHDLFFRLNKLRQNRLLSFLNSLQNHTQIPLYFETLAATPPYIQHHFLQLRPQERHTIIRGIQEGRSQKEALRFILSTRYCWKNWGIYQSAMPRIKSLLSTYLSRSENMPLSGLLTLYTKDIEIIFTRLEEFSCYTNMSALLYYYNFPPLNS